jgi:predicted RND superfamily exporter protein
MALSIPGVFRMDITVDIADFFLEDDPVIRNQEKFQQLFGTNDFIGVLVESKDVFSRQTLELIRLVGKRLRDEVPLAGDLVSLTELTSAQSGGLLFRFKGDSLVSTKEEVERIRTSYSKNRSIQGILFTRDHRQAWVLLKLKGYPSADQWSGKSPPLFSVGRKAYDTVMSIDSGKARLIATGLPVYAFRKNAEMMEDLVRVLVIGGVLALILSILILRSIQVVLGTVAVILFSVLCVFGVQGRLGISTDSAFIGVPILLTMGVSIGYTVHVFRFFSIRFHYSGKRKEAVVFAVLETGRPIFFTAFTTIAALMSFLFVEIRPIQWVGITSASCILVVFFASMLLFPAVLSMGGDREVSPTPSLRLGAFETALRRFADWVGRYGRVVIPVFLAVVVIASYGVTKLDIDFNAEKMMGTRLPHMQDQVLVSRSEIAVNDTLDLVLSAPDHSFKKAGTLKRLELLERRLEALPLVKRTSSLAAVVREINYVMHGRNPDYDVVPHNADSLQGLYDLAEGFLPEKLREWVTPNYSDTRVFMELSNFSSREIEGIIGRVDLLVKELFPKGTGHFMSGSAYQMAVMNQYITRGLIRSILTALLMITLLMVAVFKSLKLALAAMIPNVFPVLVAGGIMGYFGIPLEFVTMTVAPMIMGLAVDDTIHLVYHLKWDLKKSGDFTASIRRTFVSVGTAITVTTVILCLTFLVFTVSRVNSIINMGVITCVGILAAYLADLFVTPVLIRWMKP